MSNERTESDHIDNGQGQITMATDLTLETAVQKARQTEAVRKQQAVPVTEDSREKYQAKFPELFAGIGEMQGEYHIKLKPEARPVSVTTSRRVPLPLLGKVEAQLKEMEGNGIIIKVEEPTPWCSAMVVVPKSNGEVRICVDLTNLNKAVEREKLVLPSVEETLGRLSGANVLYKTGRKGRILAEEDDSDP
ncbi:hypothetical protein MTO96_032257 [Rhipicephalus appendiculatus]